MTLRLFLDVSPTIKPMLFPIWQYLDQPIWDSRHPFVLNPVDYWRQYRRQHLDRCLDNAFLEHCWQVDYPDFVVDYHDLCCRTALEEDPRWLIERCWLLQRPDRFGRHPENRDMERES